MKKILFLWLCFLPMLAWTQVITYDTIRVSPDDERNIHANEKRNVYNSPTATRQPIRVAKNATSGFDKSKLRIGANLDLSFSHNYTLFSFGPQVGYQFNKYLMGGTGVKYYYNKVRAYQYNHEYLYKNNLVGANLFGYFYPVNFITVFAQPEINYLWSKYTNLNSDETEKTSGFVPSVLIGAGLRLGRSHITMNYDLARHTNSPYPDRVFLGVSIFF